MANSLREQLLGAGVIDKKQAKKARLDKHLKNKKIKKSGKVVVDENRQQILQQQKDKAVRDKALNQQKQAKANERAFAAQIRQLIQMNIISRNDADRDYSFTHQDKVKNIYVNQLQQQQLSTGRVAIASLENSYELVPLGVAERIVQRDESKVIIQAKSKSVGKEDDPYADFEIPDDLMW